MLSMMVSALVAASLTLMPVDSAVAAVSPEEPAPIVEAVASDVDLQAIENAKHPEWFFDPRLLSSSRSRAF